MVLLSSMMRLDAFTGRTDGVDAWLSGRQSGRWAVQTARVGSTAARARPEASPEDQLRELTELHRRGVVTDDEFERLRARLSA
jgi:hypothetical protein